MPPSDLTAPVGAAVGSGVELPKTTPNRATATHAHIGLGLGLGSDVPRGVQLILVCKLAPNGFRSLSSWEEMMSLWTCPCPTLSLSIKP